MINKVKLGIVMMLIASLSVAALSSIPSKVAIAQTSQENQTFQPRGLIGAMSTSADLLRLHAMV